MKELYSSLTYFPPPTHKYFTMKTKVQKTILSLLLFLSLPLVMGLVFYLTFISIGPFFSNILATGIDWWVHRLSICLDMLHITGPLHALIIDGICTGVGSVLSFLPTIGILFFCLSLLETSGYLNLIAVMMDRPLSYFGLSGSCLIPLLTGFGCSVPAIMAASKLSGDQSNINQRLLTIFMIPFLSCSARLPIYAMIATAIFPQCRGKMIISLYLTGILLALSMALFYKYFLAKNSRSPFIFHPPTPALSRKSIRALHRPSLIQGLEALWYNVRDFSKKAFTVIFLGSMVIWALENFDTSLSLTSHPNESLLAFMGRAAAPLFAPLGFGDWRAVSAIIAGVTAKEAVVSTLAIMAGNPVGSIEMTQMLTETFTPLSAYCFMTFCLLYIPCIATLVTVRKELGSWKYVLQMILLQISSAWIFSFLFYQFGVLWN